MSGDPDPDDADAQTDEGDTDEPADTEDADPGSEGHGATLRRWGRRSVYAGLTVFVVFAFVLSSLYLLSFHAPVGIDERPVDYDGDPGTALANATLNLRLDAYRYRVRSNVTLPNGETRPVVEKQVVVNNPAQLYTMTRRGEAQLRNRSIPPERAYGTIDTGYSKADGNWRAGSARGYNTWAHNVFQGPGRLAGAEVSVLSNTDSQFVARVENSTLARTVGRTYPPGMSDDSTASLRVTVEKGTDRPVRAVYRYEDRTNDRIIREVYSIERGVAPDRPLGTYPPGVFTVLARIDRGVATLESLWPLTGGVVP